jgi:mannose-6-phosphate isomerase-like protein (cupin superfamily)
MVRELKVTNIGERDSEALNSVTRVKRLITKSREGSQNLMLGICFIDPGGEPFEFSYPDKDEVYYMLTGKIIVHWDGNKTEVKAGDAVFFPAGGKYATYNEGPEPSYFVYCLYPPKV